MTKILFGKVFFFYKSVYVKNSEINRCTQRRLFYSRVYTMHQVVVIHFKLSQRANSCVLYVLNKIVFKIRTSGHFPYGMRQSLKNYTKFNVNK